MQRKGMTSMELSTRKIYTNKIICHSDMQITLEDDMNVPDTKPDIDQLIKTKGEVQISDTEPKGDKVTVRGLLNFSILYITTEDIRPVHIIKGQIPIEENINMDGIDASKEIFCRFELEDCRASLINSRKVNVRAIISLHCCQEEQSEVDAGVDIVSAEASRADMEQLSPPEGLHRRFQNFSLTKRISRKKDLLRIKDEVALPKGKPNVDTILYHEISHENLQNRIVEQGIRFWGDLCIFLLYIPENEERRLEYLETEIPFDTIISCDDCSENMISDIEILNAITKLEMHGDDDGENRIMDLEYTLNLQMCFYQDETFSYLADAYSTACTLTLEQSHIEARKLLMKNQSVVRVADRIHIDNDTETILQICNTTGNIQIDEQQIVEDGITVEGAVELEILYITENDERPLAIARGTIPFNTTIEIKGIKPEDDYELQPLLGQISVIMLDSQEIEAKIVLNICAFVFTHQEKNMITGISETPKDMEYLQNLPGLVGYIASENDTLWDIAKKYNTTIESIMELNDMENENLHTGDKLLLLKQIDGI